MKITALLLAAILFIGVVSSTRLITGTYTDDKCSTLVAGSEIDSVDFKSGQCVGLLGVASVKYKVKGDKLEGWYVPFISLFFFSI